MKTNIKFFFLVILLTVILVYPLGHLLNQLFIHEHGGGFDVGYDTSSVDILIGFMCVPVFFASLLFSIYGRGNWKWFFSVVLSLPSLFFVIWLGMYIFIPPASFVVGLILVLIINSVKNKSLQNIKI